MPKGTTVQWFTIDEYNQCYFANLNSKVVYDDYKTEPNSYMQKITISMQPKKTFVKVKPINIDIN